MRGQEGRAKWSGVRGYSSRSGKTKAKLCLLYTAPESVPCPCVSQGNHCTLLGPLRGDRNWKKPALTRVPTCWRWP